MILRQSTASQEVPLGHFVDDADGKTAETALSIANTDIKVWKAGATTLANKNSGGATHISGGIYYAVLDATDTDTIGPLVLFVAVSGALAVRLECEVLDEAQYDALFGTTAYSTLTAAGVRTELTTELGRIDAAVSTRLATAGYAAPLDAAGTRSAVGLAAANLDTQIGDLPTNAELAASQASADDATLAAIAALPTPLDAAGVRTAVGLASANLDTQLAALAAYIDTEIAAILAAVDTEVAAIKAKTDNLPAAPAATGDIPTAAANADALLDRAAGIETGVTPRQALRGILAAALGKLSGAATTTVVIRDANDTKDRITATVDADGNRTAVTKDLT